MGTDKHDGKPSDAEIEEAEAELEAFLARMRAVPESEQSVLDSDKFDGPIGAPRPDRD